MTVALKVFKTVFLTHNLNSKLADIKTIIWFTEKIE